jgi:hypothetical protein
MSIALLLTATTLIVGSTAQEPLHHNGGSHGEYYYYGSGYVWWWLIFLFVGIVLLLACVYGGYSYGIASTRTRIRGEYEVRDAEGNVEKRVRFREEDVSRSYSDGDYRNARARSGPPAAVSLAKVSLQY